MKKIIINEKQEKTILSNIIYETTQFTVDPVKVLLIKDFLDKNFKRASLNGMGNDGYPSVTPIVGMIGSNGEVIKNMSDEQLFDLLCDKFKDIYANNIQRNKFIAQVMKDWFYKKISNEGLLSVNLY